MARASTDHNGLCQCGHVRAMHFQQRYDCTARLNAEYPEEGSMARVLESGRKCACVKFVKSRTKV